MKQLIVPLSLMAYGTLEASLYPKYRLLNYAVGHEVITHKPVKFRIDDYTQYVPAASVYLLNLSGVRGRHNFKDRTMILGLAGLLTGISVNTLKYTVREQRPDKSAHNSFPSGHTAVAFMGAEFLWQEYKDVSIWYGIGGYAIATGTGAFRIYNNKHWAGDVIFGAGLGILCTKLAYHLYPKAKLKLSSRRKADKSGTAFSVYPYYNGQQGGISISKQF
ncbi:phosphatase PAP2 family protein [Bacteroides helcogenes]|nr:phosphatase PAP2 family protein [Bacteroides helcogenes]MDY5237055.1 phosphatase PAP2 family protein [Bacteroides helcogenes]